MTYVMSRACVQKYLEMPEAIQVMESIFRSHGEGSATNLTTNFVFTDTLVSIKAGASHSAGRVGLKSLGTIILCATDRPREPLALIEQSCITYLRTGAAGAVAARALARENPTSVGICGSGRQARAQLDGLCAVFPSLREVKVWSPNPRNADAFAREMCEKHAISVRAVNTAEAAATGQNIVVTVTRAKEPFLRREWLAPGTHINAMGADMPGSAEIDTATLQQSKIFVDDPKQAHWMGAANVAISRREFDPNTGYCGTLGQLLAKAKAGRTSPAELTLFDCSGVGMMDVALADHLLQKAQKSAGTMSLTWLD